MAPFSRLDLGRVSRLGPEYFRNLLEGCFLARYLGLVTDQEPDDSNLDRDLDNDGEEFEDDEELAATPFDNPYFLPAVLWGLAAWFGFDIVTDAQAYQDYPNFNRGGFAVLSIAAIWFTRSAILEKRALNENRDAAGDSANDSD